MLAIQAVTAFTTLPGRLDGSARRLRLSASWQQVSQDVPTAGLNEASFRIAWRENPRVRVSAGCSWSGQRASRLTPVGGHVPLSTPRHGDPTQSSRHYVRSSDRRWRLRGRRQRRWLGYLSDYDIPRPTWLRWPLSNDSGYSDTPPTDADLRAALSSCDLGASDTRPDRPSRKTTLRARSGRSDSARS